MSNNIRLAELMNYITIDTTSGNQFQMSGSIKQTSVTSALVKANSTGVLVAAVAGTDYLTSVGISNLTATGTPSATTYLRGDNTWATIAGGGGSGTVTSVSVVSANGFTGSVATSTTTPAITIATSVSGILKGDGTSLSAAIAGTDYLTSVGISNLTATGTPSSTTYLRGDNTWASITIGGTLPVGGTAGQILSKIDATNYNTTWIDNFASQLKHDVKLGATLTKGTAVYISTSDGTNMVVSAASNASESTSSKTLGLLETGGVTNDPVKVITEGLLAGLDTSTATAGDPVWLGTSGNLIFGLANKPVAPAHLVFIGIVTRVQSQNGEIFVKVQNGFELHEIHDVLVGSYVNKDILYRDTTTNLWKNASIPTVLGYTPESTSNKGVAGGYASLDGGGLVPSTQLPSYVDDVLEYADLAALPATGVTGKIYVTLDSNKIYRWSGTVYIEVSPTVGTTWGGITGTLSNQTDLQNALNAKQNTITLTTTGNSGSATLITSTLNIPTYTLAGLGGQASSVNLTSLSGLTYASASFVKMTAANTFTLDTATYLTGNQSITLSGAVTGSGTTAIATTLSNSVVGIANLSATGTPSATTYLRGDNTWATVSAGGGGTVTSVAALTLGTTGTDLSSSVATATTTPVITLNVPTASATNRGALSSADWSTFNSKQGTITLTTTGSSGSATFATNTLNIPTYTLSGLGGQASSTNLTSLSGLSYVSASFVKMTAAGTFSLDTTTYYAASNPSGYTSNTGTVTSVAALTLGTTGTDLSSSVATGTTTPVITLNVPTASAANRGALSAADWSTFNGKQAAISLTTTGSSGAATFATNTLNIPNYTLAGLGGQASSTNLTSLSGLSFVSTSFVKMTAAGTFALDTNAYYLSSNPSGYTNNTGTVTSVSVTTANGVSGSVATSTTTPAITLTLGAITPTTVNGLTLAAAVTGFTIAGGSTTSKTLTISNTLTLAGTDTSTLNIGTGGTLGSAAFTASTAYQASNTNLSSLAGLSFASTSFVKMTAAGTFALDTNTYYLSSNPSGYTNNTGTVTSVSVTTANGVSGSVATNTTTPAITLTLGAITPTTVNGITLSGTSTPTLAVTGTSSISGANTGDNAVNSLYSGLVSNATHTGDATGATALTVVGLRGVALPTLTAGGGLLKYTGTGTNTWVFDTSAYLTGITSGQVTTALGYTPYNSTNPSGYISGNQSITLSGDVSGTGTTAITTTLATVTQAATGSFVKITLDTKGRVTGNTAVGSGDITTALGYTPYNSTNPNGYTSNVGTVTSVGGTGTVSGLTLSGTVTTSGNLTLGGTLSLTSGNVTTALGYTPYNSTNPNGYITSSASITGSSASAILISSSGALTTQYGDGFLGFSQALTNNQNGLFAGSDNSNSILTLNRHPGNYYSQLGFSSNGNLYYRAFSNTAINTSQAWRTIWDSTTLTNLNQLTNGPGYLTGITSGQVTTALGYTPYNSTNPNGYTSNTGTVTSVSGTGTVSGLTLSGTVTTSGSLTLGGTLSLTSGNVTTALGYTPYNATNPNGYTSNTGTVTGTGTANTITKWTGTSSIGNGMATDNGTTFAISGAMTATGDITAFASDERLKENIVNIPNALNKILSLNGVTYDWNDKALAFGFVSESRKHDVGLIAQQVEAVLPEAIAPAPFDTDVDSGNSISGDNYLTVRYDKMVALLIEGMKEQQAQIEELKLKLNSKND